MKIKIELNEKQFATLLFMLNEYAIDTKLTAMELSTYTQVVINSKVFDA